jgi:hypothetical protein
MFWAISCSSSGGEIVLIQHLVSSLSVSDCPVHQTVMNCLKHVHVEDFNNCIKKFVHHDHWLRLSLSMLSMLEVFLSVEDYVCKWCIDVYSRAVLEDDAFTRMKGIVKWYLSGFYKKPKGLKKPYNPILGETFRCYWKHPNGSRTFYLAEQVNADVYSYCRPLCYVWSTVSPVRKDRLSL